MELKLKFFRGKKGNIISKAPSNLFSSNSNDDRNYIIFPSDPKRIQEGKIYECSVFVKRPGIAIARPIREVQPEYKAIDLYILTEPKVLLESEFYPKERKFEKLTPYKFEFENNFIYAYYKYQDLEEKKLVSENDEEWELVPEELKERYHKYWNEVNKKEEERQKKFEEKLKRFEAEIVKTPLEVRHVKLSPDEITIRHIYDDIEFGRYKPTYDYITTKVYTKRGLSFDKAWRKVCPDPTFEEALEDESYTDPDEIKSIDDLPAHKQFFEMKEKFNQMFIKEIQTLSKEAYKFVIKEITKELGKEPENPEKFKKVQFIRYIPKINKED